MRGLVQVQALLGALVGLALIGWGGRILVRGEAAIVRATGQVWRGVFQAAAFWLLLGVACLVLPFVWLAVTAGWMGSDASFWILCTPAPLAALAVVWFRPRRLPGLRRR